MLELQNGRVSKSWKKWGQKQSVSAEQVCRCFSHFQHVAKTSFTGGFLFVKRFPFLQPTLRIITIDINRNTDMAGTNGAFVCRLWCLCSTQELQYEASLETCYKEFFLSIWCHLKLPYLLLQSQYLFLRYSAFFNHLALKCLSFQPLNTMHRLERKRDVFSRMRRQRLSYRMTTHWCIFFFVTGSLSWLHHWLETEMFSEKEASLIIPNLPLSLLQPFDLHLGVFSARLPAIFWQFKSNVQLKSTPFFT